MDDLGVDSIRHRYRVLLVDDDPAALRVLQRSLAREHEVYTAASPEEALLHLAANALDAIVTDYEMPGSPDSVWLLSEVRRRWPTSAAY